MEELLKEDHINRLEYIVFTCELIGLIPSWEGLERFRQFYL